ncbi:hypothetical protein AB0C65_19585 [Nocardia sp. NPDC048505]|uniref:DUF2201 family putative metallopeptidase n=1 Tax=Nocardia sp. NPDC048505 TaxID=3155756 RepID=UPI003401DB56
MARGGKGRIEPWRQAVLDGWRLAHAHPAFRHLPDRLYELDEHTPRAVWAHIDDRGIGHHPKRRAAAGEWAWVFAHCLLHAGFGHLDPRSTQGGHILADGVPHPAYRAACCAVVDQYLVTMKIGSRPLEFPDAPALADEHETAARWRDSGVPAAYQRPDPVDFVIDDAETARKRDYPAQFAAGLGDAARAALETASGQREQGAPRAKSAWDLALDWFVSSYPLLGALATGMTIVAEVDLARGWDISIAAVNAEAGEIYINPLAGLGTAEWRFVLAHEMLHAALRHGERAGWRDPYLFNIACDYVVNGWLVEMGVGEMPDGLLHDPDLKGFSAEEVYDRIATDLRRLRKLATLRGRGRGDVLGEPLPRPGSAGRFVDLDEYYRSALVTGLAYHHNHGRGSVPAGLEEAIRALDHPPLPWDAALARWFDEHIPSVDKKRSYARASRRQAATPRHPAPRLGASGGGRAPAHLRRGTGHLRLHGRATARKSPGRHRLLRHRARCSPRPRRLLRRRTLRRRVPPGRRDRPGRARPRSRRHHPATRDPSARACRGLPTRRPDPRHHRRLLRCAARAARTRLPAPGRRESAVPSPRAGIPRPLSESPGWNRLRPW